MNTETIWDAMESKEKIDYERKLAIGLWAAKEGLLTTSQIALRISASFGQSGAENIARAILNKTEL